jgi:hypothetical protein
LGLNGFHSSLFAKLVRPWRHSTLDSRETGVGPITSLFGL